MDDRLARVMWIGGSPCSGKSSIADRLATAFGLDVYCCDEAYERHRIQLDPALQPVFARLAESCCDDVWMRPVQQQISEELELYREEFPMILADILAHPMLDRDVAHGGPGIIAEGAALLPELVDGLEPNPSRVIWIFPIEAFQREHYARRGWRHDVLRTCTDPAVAWENWMARDAGFARAAATDAAASGYRVVWVDGSRSLDQMAGLVAEHFRLRVAAE